MLKQPKGESIQWLGKILKLLRSPSSLARAGFVLKPLPPLQHGGNRTNSHGGAGEELHSDLWFHAGEFCGFELFKAG